MTDNDELFVTEMFRSLQGESLLSGYPTFFVRLSGCNLRCSFCDAAHSYPKGTSYTINSIMEEAKRADTAYLCVTGGEPLMQTGAIPLLRALVDTKLWKVSLETNGTVSVENVPKEVVKVVDVKLGASGEQGTFLHENLNYLTPHDEVKFVVENKNDFDEAKKFIETYFTGNNTPTLTLSPSFGKISAKQLGKLLLESPLKQTRMQIQLHKIADLQ